MKALAVLVVVSCWLTAASQHEGEAESSITIPPCAVSRDTLDIFFEDLLPGLEVVVNCLSFDETGALSSGVVSGINETAGGVGEMRFVLRCLQEVLTARSSSQDPSSVEMMSTACMECADTAATPCTGSCASPCERCYGSTTACTRCIACVNVDVEHCFGEVLVTSDCASECPVEFRDINPELFNYCECPDCYRQLLEYTREPEGEEVEEVPLTCSDAPSLEEYTLVEVCGSGMLPNEELNEICFACGLEFCAQCEGANTLESPFQCTICLEHTVLFDHECYACPLSLVALNAILQEEELAEEVRDQMVRQIELAVSLPILSVLVIVFFVLMTVLAHYRYPHLSPTGHKRHRTKQEDDLAPLESNSDFELSTPPENVWRSRPTVRLR